MTEPKTCPDCNGPRDPEVGCLRCTEAILCDMTPEEVKQALLWSKQRQQRKVN